MKHHINVQGSHLLLEMERASHFCRTAPLLPKRGIYEGLDNLLRSSAVQRSKQEPQSLAHRSKAVGTAAAGRKAARAGGRWVFCAPFRNEWLKTCFGGTNYIAPPHTSCGHSLEPPVATCRDLPMAAVPCKPIIRRKLAMHWTIVV